MIFSLVLHDRSRSPPTEASGVEGFHPILVSSKPPSPEMRIWASIASSWQGERSGRFERLRPSRESDKAELAPRLRLGIERGVAHTTSLVLYHYPVDTRRLNLLFVHADAGSVLVGALAIVWAIVRDRRSGVSADGLHRLGFGTWLAIAAIPMFMYLLYLV
jgi:hypothetical protein